MEPVQAANLRLPSSKKGKAGACSVYCGCSADFSFTSPQPWSLAQELEGPVPARRLWQSIMAVALVHSCSMFQGVVALPLKILPARAALLLLCAAVGNCSCTYMLMTLLQEALTLTEKRAGC